MFTTYICNDQGQNLANSEPCLFLRLLKEAKISQNLKLSKKLPTSSSSELKTKLDPLLERSFYVNFLRLLKIIVQKI